MTTKGRTGRIAVVAAIVSVLGTASAIATPGKDATSTVMARATFAGDVKVQQNHSADVLVAENTFLAGGHSGWHAHPGTTVILVKTGSISIYTLQPSGSCTKATYGAGQGFVEQAGVYQIGINEGSDPTDLWVTFLNVPIGGANRIDLPVAAVPTGAGCPVV